jgi:hypothetical protein
MSPMVMIPGQWEARRAKAAPAVPTATAAQAPAVPDRAAPSSANLVEREGRSWLGMSILAVLIVAMLLAMWASASARPEAHGASMTIPSGASPLPIRAVVASS